MWMRCTCSLLLLYHFIFGLHYCHRCFVSWLINSMQGPLLLLHDVHIVSGGSVICLLHIVYAVISHPRAAVERLWNYLYTFGDALPPMRTVGRIVFPRVAVDKILFGVRFQHIIEMLPLSSGALILVVWDWVRTLTLVRLSFKVYPQDTSRTALVIFLLSVFLPIFFLANRCGHFKNVIFNYPI